MTMYLTHDEEKRWPNVAMIHQHGLRVVRGRVPAQVRAELREAVKAGKLCHLKKDGLKPEIFYHPNCKTSAVECQKREAEYAVGCISRVVASGAEKAEYDYNSGILI